MTTRTRRLIGVGIVAAVVAALAIPKIISLTSSADGPSGDGRASGNGRRAGAPGGSGSRDGSGRRDAGRPVPVTAVVVRSSVASDRVRVTGTISPYEQIDVQSEVAGKIVRIHFREGSVVRRGALLVKMNDADLRARLARATALKELADAKEERVRQMRERDAASQAEYDIALSEKKSAAADIALLRAEIARTEIRAPFSGRVGLREVSVGSYITPSTRIATLSAVTPAKVDFAVPERYASLVRPGASVDFTVQGTSTTFTATVYAVEPRIDEQTRTLAVRATCRGGSGALKPGAFAEIDLSLSQRSGALLVPSEAVIPDAGGAKVFVAKNGRAESRTIDIGLRTDRQVEVTRGLVAGDTVIATGIQQVRPGVLLNVTAINTL